LAYATRKAKSTRTEVNPNPRVILANVITLTIFNVIFHSDLPLQILFVFAVILSLEEESCQLLHSRRTGTTLLAASFEHAVGEQSFSSSIL
jgi:hypothetical protein